ncbi:hypothetical protein EV182_001873, partial [Spiromyces aspiralis]
MVGRMSWLYRGVVPSKSQYVYVKFDAQYSSICMLRGYSGRTIIDDTESLFYVVSYVVAPDDEGTVKVLEDLYSILFGRVNPLALYAMRKTMICGRAAMGQQNVTVEQFDYLCQQVFQGTTSSQRNEAERQLAYYFPTFTESPTQAQRNDRYGGAVNVEGIIEIHPDIKGPVDAVKHMSWLLQSSHQLFTRVFALQRIRTVILYHIGLFSSEDKLALYDTLLGFVQSNVGQLTSLVVADTARILALVILHSWHDAQDTKKFFSEIKDFAKQSEQHQIVALQVQRVIVDEFSRDVPVNYTLKQRRT